MKPHTILRAAALAIISASSQIHGKNTGDDNTNSDPSASTTGHAIIPTPTYAQTVDDVIREMMEDFSHGMTSLHDSFVRHPLFSHPRFGGDVKSSSSKPYSTWGHFGSLSRWSPRYEVIDDAKTFQVKMDVPGFHFHEMKVELESGGRVLSISGTKESNFRETSEDRDGNEKKAAMGEKADKEGEEGKGEKFEYYSHSSSSFKQKFTLDPSVETSLMTANLVNGVLEVRAPRKHGAWNGRHIPITQFDEDMWSELMTTDEDGETDQATVTKD